MSGVILFAILAGVPLGWFVIVRRRAQQFDEPQDLLPPGRRAFDERIHVDPVLSVQTERLRHLVDSVGISRVVAGAGGRLVQRGEEHVYVDEDSYDVWLIDTLGEVHEVTKGMELAPATRLVQRLATALDARLIDDDGLTRSRGPAVWDGD